MRTLCKVNGESMTLSTVLASLALPGFVGTSSRHEAEVEEGGPGCGESRQG
jgi:hypothetical protein